jgi:hypothetical protein
MAGACGSIQQFAYSREWRAVAGRRANLLVVGRPELERDLRAMLEERLAAPLHVIDGAPGALPPGGTILFRGIDRLNHPAQHAVLAWLDGSDVQVISMIASPLYPRVLAGSFLASLYYRLNTVYVEFDHRADELS